jgi:hypothetical protein
MAVLLSLSYFRDPEKLGQLPISGPHPKRDYNDKDKHLGKWSQRAPVDDLSVQMLSSARTQKVTQEGSPTDPPPFNFQRAQKYRPHRTNKDSKSSASIVLTQYIERLSIDVRNPCPSIYEDNGIEKLSMFAIVDMWEYG